MVPGINYFNCVHLGWLHVRNRLSLKPLAAFNSVITNFYAKSPFHGHHWSWDMMIRTNMKILESTSSRAGFRTLQLAPSPSFFPWWKLAPRNCPQLFFPHNMDSFLIWTEHLSLTYSFSALIFWVYLLWTWYRCICINIISYFKIQEPRDGVQGHILYLWFLCLKFHIMICLKN